MIPPPAECRRRVDRLAPRERSILAGIVHGLTSREIAGLHGVTLKTIEAQRKRLRHKLGVPNGPAIVRVAMRAGRVA